MVMGHPWSARCRAGGSEMYGRSRSGRDRGRHHGLVPLDRALLTATWVTKRIESETPSSRRGSGPPVRMARRKRRMNAPWRHRHFGSHGARRTTNASEFVWEERPSCTQSAFLSFTPRSPTPAIWPPGTLAAGRPSRCCSGRTAAGGFRCDRFRHAVQQQCGRR